MRAESRQDFGSASTVEGSTPRKVGILDALDTPPELVPVQDAYWQARREWMELQHAYLTVFEHMLSRSAAPAGAERPQDSAVVGDES